MINLTINGMALEAPEGWTVLQAAEAAGIVIPTLCHHPDLTPFGGCRLCVVEVKGARLPATACNLPVSKDLQVQTETPRLVEYRRAVLKMLLSSFYDAGYKRCGGEPGLDQDSQFAYWVRFYGLEMAKEMAPRPRGPVDSDPNPYVWVDMNKCIQCTRCVRACAEIQGRFVWAQAYRGSESRIVAGADSTMLASRCESCGACVAYCPTGALDNKMSVSLGRADRLASSVCSY
ncbi:MAG: 2Fe-2S iron-sulfur cluster-binding protein [Chloroflexota bacterium]